MMRRMRRDLWSGMGLGQRFRRRSSRAPMIGRPGNVCADAKVRQPNWLPVAARLGGGSRDVWLTAATEALRGIYRARCSVDRRATYGESKAERAERESPAFKRPYLWSAPGEDPVGCLSRPKVRPDPWSGAQGGSCLGRLGTRAQKRPRVPLSCAMIVGEGARR